jgi:hypothetical protein
LKPGKVFEVKRTNTFIIEDCPALWKLADSCAKLYNELNFERKQAYIFLCDSPPLSFQFSLHEILKAYIGVSSEASSPYMSLASSNIAYREGTWRERGLARR